MLKGADLSKLLDDDFGDAGFNDPISDEETTNSSARKPLAPTKAQAKLGTSLAGAAAAAKVPAAGQAPKSGSGSQGSSSVGPHSRPVLGATLPPPEGTDPKRYELAQALDTAAREKGFESADAYATFLEEQQGSGGAAPGTGQLEEPPLAPGIKKAPAYMPPGAYPGDRTKLGKEYDEEALQQPSESQPDCDGEHVSVSFVKQAERLGERPSDGHSVEYRLDGCEDVQKDEIGAGQIPWGLEQAVQRMKAGDIVDVIAKGEHAFADTERIVDGAERRWRLELISVSGRSKDKFKLDADERIELANRLRLCGNDMFKQGRLLRAMDYYERGSRLMDVLEAEEIGMPGGASLARSAQSAAAAERNQRIWACQKPLLLNWALILIKKGRWREAERKCTEVLMDIEKENVKALFRRGQCNIHLRNHEQARSDLRRAAELDTSIAKEVERELQKVEQMQKAVDLEDVGFAKKVVGELLQDPDPRSVRPPSSDQSATKDGQAHAPADKFLSTLREHDAAVERDSIDDEVYRQQRQAIYNHFINGGAPRTAEDEDG